MYNLVYIFRSAKQSPQLYLQKAQFSWRSLHNSTWKKLLVTGGLVTAGVITLATPVFAFETNAHAHHLPWSHNGPLAVYDHASVRRGYQVYKQVCSACHSLKYLTYRELIGAVLTEDEAKADASEISVQDGPDDNGDMFERPGRLTDTLPSPYPNPEAARAANNGALPPDLTLIVKARHGAEDYVFHLLTGYCDPPPGRDVAEGQYYNPYFPGQAIGMAPPLYNEIIDYEDGTPNSLSQLAKDVVTFLCWTSDPSHDQRKRALFKATVVTGILTILIGLKKTQVWSTIKTRKIRYVNRPMPKDV